MAEQMVLDYLYTRKQCKGSMKDELSIPKFSSSSTTSSHFGLIEKMTNLGSYLTWSVKICKRALPPNSHNLQQWYCIGQLIYCEILNLLCSCLLWSILPQDIIRGARQGNMHMREWNILRGCIIIIQTNWVNIDFLS